MNLKKFRDANAEQLLLQFLNDHPDVITPDQSALNWLCRNDAALLSDGWGVFPIEAFNDSIDIHAWHISGGAPWKGMPNAYEWMMFHRMADTWYDFCKAIFGIDTKKKYASRRGQAYGMTLQFLTRIALALHLSPPAAKHYLTDAKKVLFNRESTALFHRKLLRLATGV